jgi:hypothetical protein
MPAQIAHCRRDVARLILLGAGHQLSSPNLNRLIASDRIQDQIQDDLLQLNTIAINKESAS